MAARGLSPPGALYFGVTPADAVEVVVPDPGLDHADTDAIVGSR
jgi:hypothetical protein